MATFHGRVVQSRDIPRIDFTEYLKRLKGELSRLHGTSGNGIGGDMGTSRPEFSPASPAEIKKRLRA